MRSTKQLTGTVTALLLAATPLAAQTPAVASDAGADTVAISLGEAVERAVGQSQEVRLARAQVSYADAQVRVARADLFPQINGSLTYTRTFRSAFSGGGGFELPDSMRFEPDPNAPLEDRVRYLEQNAENAGLGGLGSLFGNLPFGQEHAYNAGLTGSQVLFSPRLGAALRIARNVEEGAGYVLREEVAEIELDVRSAYYGALLARELESISLAAVEQAQEFLDAERLRLRSGTVSELEVLRAEVSLANLQPQLVEARNAADLAELDLKRLLDVPLRRPVKLTSPLAVPSAIELADSTPAPEVVLAHRAAVSAAERQVAVREQQVSLARSSFLPTARVSMNYGGQLFPTGAFEFGGQDWRTDWNLAVGIELPIFTGFRRPAEIAAANAELEQAELQLGQLRESVQLQYEQARSEKERARASIAARQSTVGQAQRVHDLTVLRYERGLATQLEVSEARLSLLQSRSNLAQALADFYTADAGLVRALGTGTPVDPEAPTQMPESAAPAGTDSPAPPATPAPQR